MKLLIDIADNKAASFMELIKNQFDAKAKPISAPDAAVLEELTHIKKAFKNLDKVKAGKLPYPLSLAE
jgi:hypothetical protein